MIQIESVRIEEFRGVRELTLSMAKGNFVVSGPNGSGKSGIVDAIEFALTGSIGRLTGAGSSDLNLADHGPHVEKRSYPDVASVELKVNVPHLKKSASIKRTISKPRQPTITPDEESVRAVFAELATHPEITLSRREIIKFILAEAGRRSRDVQTLLKLEDIDQSRGTLKTVENRLSNEFAAAKARVDETGDSLKRHLDLPALVTEDLLSVVNRRRKVLDLPPIETLTKDTDVSEGIAGGTAGDAMAQTKGTALADLRALMEAIEGGSEKKVASTTESILRDSAKIAADPDLLASIKRRPLVESGLNLVADGSCPLCDQAWDITALREHLGRKLERSKEAEAIRSRLLSEAANVGNEIARIRGLLRSVLELPEMMKEPAGRLREWEGGLGAFAELLSKVDGVLATRERFAAGWAHVPDTSVADLRTVIEKVNARPDKSAAAEASAFLIVAQERLKAWRLARREAESRKGRAALGRTAYKTYCEVAEEELVRLYAEVENDFSEYYRLINQDDEGEFRAKFEPSDGKLGLLVDFHKKGMFPPGAYHSEGHQDGMGVCLYLALMKRVLGDDFTLAVLDDVVMSVDSQHRKQFCKLLKVHFPKTQFIITTHDEVWARQIRTEGLVGAKSAIAFHTWTVETGPVLGEVIDVWDKIDADLAKNDVPAAASHLRRHLEYVAGDLADELGAKVKFRADGAYDKGELWSAVIGRQSEVLKDAARAAKSWKDDEALARVEALQQQRAVALAACNGEEWVINKAIHYNQWIELAVNDFRPVVGAFRQILAQFRCAKATCDSWLSLAPRINPTDLRCSCGAFRFNLKEK